MKTLRSFLLLTVLFVSMQSFAADTCALKNYAFQPGEKVTYRVSYHWNSLWMSAGDVTFSCEESSLNNKNVYHVTGYGETYKSYDWFYRVRDKYESYIDEQTLKPLKFIRDVNEGGYTIYNNVNFNQSANKATSTNGTYSIPSCTQDVISSIYWARNIDFSKLTPGQKVPFNMFIDDSTYAIYIKYDGKEKLVTSAGTFNCIKFKPLLINGTMFKGGERMAVWVTDDNNHIPVRIESDIAVGSIAADVYKWEGLRSPMTAKLN